MELINDRVGNFTSSEIHKLCGAPKPRKTYIQRKNFERKLGRMITADVSARPLAWGKLCETRVHNLLGLEYALTSQEVIHHPEIKWWKGSPDLITLDTVSEVKCPYTLDAYCQKYEAMEGGPEKVKVEFPDCYYQLTSNAILTKKRFAELIIYCPYKDELAEIKFLAENFDGENQGQYLFIYHALDKDLPHLIKGNYYKNMLKLKWEVTEADKVFLTDQVLSAGKELQSLTQPK